MGEFTLWTSTQIPHIAKVTLSGVVGIPESKLRIIAPDVGGGFGSKLNVYAEEALALALARRARPSRQVDRGAERELRGHDPRPRRDARLHARRHRGRQDPRDEVRGGRRHGRVLPAAHARGSPSWAAGSTWGRTTPRPTGSSSPAS